jgi:hypothetical protein
MILQVNIWQCSFKEWLHKFPFWDDYNWSVEVKHFSSKGRWYVDEPVWLLHQGRSILVTLVDDYGLMLLHLGSWRNRLQSVSIVWVCLQLKEIRVTIVSCQKFQCKIGDSSETEFKSEHNVWMGLCEEGPWKLTLCG